MPGPDQPQWGPGPGLPGGSGCLRLAAAVVFNEARMLPRIMIDAMMVLRLLVTQSSGNSAWQSVIVTVQSVSDSDLPTASVCS